MKVALRKIELKVTDFDIKCFGYAFMFILYLPAFITRIVDIPYWGVICYSIILVADLYYVYKMKNISTPVYMTVLFFGYFLLTTIFMNFPQTFNCLLRTYIAVSFALMMEYIFTTYRSKNCIRILMRVMEVFNYMNLLFMFLYPAGMYRVVSNGIYEDVVEVAPDATRTAGRVLWLLGHQTMLIRFTLPAICIAIVYCSMETGKFKLNVRGGLLIAVCIVETYIANSAGNYLILAVFVIIMILFHFRGRIKTQYIYPLIIIAYVILASTSGDLSVYTWLSIGLKRDVKISTRVPIWINSINAWLKHPIFGCGYINDGIEAIRKILSAGNPHSSYLWTLYEGGIVGFGFMIYYIQTFAKRMENCWTSKIAKIIYASFICLLICMIDDDHIFRSQFYIIIFEITYHIPEIISGISERQPPIT